MACKPCKASQRREVFLKEILCRAISGEICDLGGRGGAAAGSGEKGQRHGLSGLRKKAGLAKFDEALGLAGAKAPV